MLSYKKSKRKNKKSETSSALQAVPACLRHSASIIEVTAFTKTAIAQLAAAAKNAAGQLTWYRIILLAFSGYYAIDRIALINALLFDWVMATLLHPLNLAKSLMASHNFVVMGAVSFTRSK